MKKLRERLKGLVAPSVRRIIMLLAVIAAGGAWATVSLEESGGFVTADSTLAFKGVTLSDIASGTVTLAGRFSGGWSGSAKGGELTFADFQTVGDTVTCQAKLFHNDGTDDFIKGVLLEFTQVGEDVNVKMTGAKYVRYATDINTDLSGGNEAKENGEWRYSVCHLRRTTTPEIYRGATVVWESDFSTDAGKVGIDGNTYVISDLKGNTIDGDGNIAIGSGNGHYGVLVNLPDQTQTKMTVLIKYKGLAAYTTANSGLFSFKTADNNVYGFRSNGTGSLTMVGFNEGSGNYWPPSPTEAITLLTGTGVYLVSTDTSVGISGYTGKGISALEGATVAPYSNGGKITSITLGGSHNINKIYAWDGITIEKVAIFMGEDYGPSDLADYVFPGDVASIPAYDTLNTVNVNFTDSSANITTDSNVGLVGVPGTKWNNMPGENGAQGEIKVVDATGSTSSAYPELAVKVSGSRGSWKCSLLAAASDLRNGYVDESASGTTPTITVGVPFDKYRVIVYHATDSNGASFGYDTINGDNLCYDSDNWLRDGSGATSWGNAGGSNTALEISEGVNTLVTGVYTDKPLKIVGHRESSSVRGCIAAVQVVKVVEKDITAGGDYTLEGLFGSVSASSDYVINVKESATLNIASATTLSSIEFNVDEGKTLTLTGSTLTATVGLNVNGKGVVSTSVLTQLAGPLKGEGILAYTLSNDKSSIPSGPMWTKSAWRGTVWLKNNKSLQNFDPGSFGNSGSTVRLTGMKGYFPNSNPTCAATVELVDDGTTAAFEQDNAYNATYTFSKVKGSGTFKTSGSQSSGHNVVMQDVSEFTGQIKVARRTVAIGAAPSTWPGVDGGTIYVASGTTATIENAKSWTAKNVTVDGTLKIKGTGSLSASGTVTCEGGKIDVSEAATSPASAVISGALAINASTTFAFPAGATFPYYLATSISGADSLPAASYTIGGADGVGALRLASGKVYPATSGTFEGGVEAINWTALGWTPSYGSVTDMGSAECSVTVAASGTLNLGTVVAGKVTIVVPELTELTLDSGSITADEINFTGGGTVVCKASNTLNGKITGSVTIQYPEHVLPTGAIWTDTAWKGTNVLVNCGREMNGEYSGEGNQEHGIVAFAQYGNEKSFIRAPGYKGVSAAADQNTTCEATLIVDTIFELNHGTDPTATEFNSNGAGYRFAKLVGDGVLRLDGTTDTAQYIFDDVSGFTGNLEITFPAEGGRKSFLFAAESYKEIRSGAYAANLVIVDDVAVAAGKVWNVPAGIIINDNATLTLGDGATIKALSPDSRGILSVPSGTATLEGVTNSVVNATLDIAEGATLNITDTSIKKLTIPANFAGRINLSGCTVLEELHLVLGSLKSFDLNKITLPTSGTTVHICYDIGAERDLSVYGTLPERVYAIYGTETSAEYGAGNFKVSNVPNTVQEVWMIRINGTPIQVTHEGGDAAGEYSYKGGSIISGSACWHDWDFEWTEGSKLRDFGKDYETIGVSLKVATEGSFDYSTDFKVGNESKCSIPSYVHPYAESSMTFGPNWSAAIRCTMPSAAGKHVAIAFGDTDNGILGLASGESPESGVVELFNWTDGTYTALAKLQVESATDDMHIYVFAVEKEDAKNFVSFYRDGEFIHKAEFALTGSITNFMVGAALVGENSGTRLPAADTNEGNTTGYVDYVRLYGTTVDETIPEALSARRPFISKWETYVRTVVTGVSDWSEDGAWASKTNETVRADTPEDGTHVTFVAKAETTAYINLQSPATYNTLIFDGDSPITIASNGKGTIGAQMIVVRTAVTNNYGAVIFREGMVGVDPGAQLAFDFTDYPFAPTQEVIKLTGPVVAREYDPSVDSRIIVANTPSHTWRVSDPTPDVNTESPTYLSYYVRIEPERTVGTTPIYYQGGLLEGGMTGDVSEGTGVFSDAGFSSATTLLEGDNVVIPSGFTSGDVLVSKTFDGNLNVKCSTLNITPVGDAVLDGRTITADDDCEVHFKGGNYGALILAGGGTFIFDEDAMVASLDGTPGFTVSDGATLALGAVSPFVDGDVSGTGTVLLPADIDTLDLNDYGSTDGMLALSDTTDVTITEPVVSQALLLDGDVAITLVGGAANSFATIAGAGTPTLKDGATAPTSITIGNIDGRAISLDNNSATAVTVSRITLNADVAGGELLLARDGVVTVAEVHVGYSEEGYSKRFDVSDGDSAWQLFYDEDGVYRASAKRGGTTYKTIQAAITAATDADLDSITVLDESAVMPTGYYYDSGTKKVAKYAAAIVYATGTPDYYKTVQAAVYAANFLTYQSQEYLYVEAYVSEDVATAMTLKIKPVDAGVTVNVTVPGITSESALNESTSDGVTTYTLGLAPTVYTWYSGIDSGVWNSMIVAPWRYSESGTPTQATRTPDTVDDVVFASDASVVVGANITVASITNNSAAITLTKAGSGSVTVTATRGIVLTGAGASITISGVTLSSEPTTGDDYVKVVKTESEGVTNYALVPDIGEETKYDSTEAAEAAAAVAVEYMLVPEGVSDAAAYKGLFEGKVTPDEGSGKYVVTLELTLTAKNDIHTAIDTAFADPVVTTEGSVTTGTITVDTKPGLYYVVETSSTAGSGYTNSAEPVMATGSTLDLAFPMPASGVLYYRVKVTP